MANPNSPDFVAGSGYTAISRGILKSGDIRHYGDNVPTIAGQGAIVPGSPTPGNKPSAAELPALKLDNTFIPPGTTAKGGDAQSSASFTTKGRPNGYALQGGGTIGGGDASNEGYDGYGKL